MHISGMQCGSLKVDSLRFVEFMTNGFFALVFESNAHRALRFNGLTEKAIYCVAYMTNVNVRMR